MVYRIGHDPSSSGSIASPILSYLEFGISSADKLGRASARNMAVKSSSVSFDQTFSTNFRSDRVILVSLRSFSKRSSMRPGLQINEKMREPINVHKNEKDIFCDFIIVKKKIQRFSMISRLDWTLFIL